MSAPEKFRIAVLGASGYTGAELLRLLRYHPRAEIRALTADRQAGKPIGAVFPHLAGEDLPDLVDRPRPADPARTACDEAPRAHVLPAGPG